MSILQIVRFGGKAAAIVALAAGVALAAPVSAKPIVKTKVKSYSVPGTSPHALLTYMQRNGPNVNGSHALASTAASIHHKADFQGTRNCKIKNYKLTMSFEITLPKATQAKSMKRSVRKRWKQFVSHARWHENRHKAIWLGCAKRIERKVRALSGSSSCNAVWAKAKAVAKVELARCDRLHAAFDRKETARASRIPLIAQALRAPRSRSGAAALRRSLTFRHSRVQAINR
ncbi:MAG: DUF922 domain-containing protein [Pseudomonadota bacterium]